MFDTATITKSFLLILPLDELYSLNTRLLTVIAILLLWIVIIVYFILMQSYPINLLQMKPIFLLLQKFLLCTSVSTSSCKKGLITFVLSLRVIYILVLLLFEFSL